MKKNQFVHLHVHSDYTLMKGMCKINNIANIAENYKMPAVALTDYVSMGGVVEFYKHLALSGDVKPIIGCEICISSDKQLTNSTSQVFHLILLAKDYTGYQNLCRIVSASFADMSGGQPCIDKKVLLEHSQGLIALSGGLNGEISQLILNNALQDAKNAIHEYIDIFGRDDFYLELSDHGLDSEKKVNRELIAFSKEFDIKVVATHDVRYLRKEDAKAYNILRCIRNNTTIDALDKYPYNHEEYYFKTADEMAAIFADIPEAISNTLEIAEKCNLKIPMDNPVKHWPSCKSKSGESSRTYLRKLCVDGISERYGFDVNDSTLSETQSQIVERMKYELDVIGKNNFRDYFLILHDIVRYARENNIPVGPGRGTVGGSIVCFLLEISDIDPICHNLVFERFLNPCRISIPDIDLDICDIRRDELVEYIRNKYGPQNVANIATYQEFKGASLLKSVAKVLGRSISEQAHIVALAQNSPTPFLRYKLDGNDELQEFLKKEKWAQEAFEYALCLERVKKEVYIRPIGIIIGDSALKSIVPLFTEKNKTIAQYQASDCEDLGILKLDFLGLKPLTQMQSIIEKIKHNNNNFDLRSIPINDQKTLELFRNGDTADIFQFASLGTQDLCREFCVTSFEDIIAIFALYRPGLLQFIPEFIACKNGDHYIEYEDPRIEPIVKETHGMIIYQEQIILIFKEIAAFSLGEADILRRALGKKKQDLIEIQYKKFIEGCKKNGVNRLNADLIWKKIVKFAGYAFNKSHAVGYAIIAYRMAYLKAHYPQDFRSNSV